MNSNRFLYQSVTFILVIFCYVPRANAGYLTINGYSSLKAAVEGDKLHITGSYDIENTGDERAVNVYPTIQLGSWQWAGDARALDVNARENWEVNEILDISRLSCAEDKSCAGLELPLYGISPVFVRKIYEDLNGYRFSAPDIVQLSIGSLAKEEVAAIRINQLQARLSLRDSGQKFSGGLEINNQLDESKSVSVSFWTTRELLLQTEPTAMHVSSGSVERIRVSLKNYSALVGSSYPVIAVLQWEESGIRNSMVVSTIVNVQKAERGGYFFWGAIISLTVCVLLVYFRIVKARSGRAIARG